MSGRRLIVWGWRCGALAAAGASRGFVPQPVTVETVAGGAGTLRATVDEDGKTRMRQRYVVAAPLAGRLTRIALQAQATRWPRTMPCGHAAAAGAVARPAQPPRGRRNGVGAAEAALERSKATVERAQAQADQARTELDRTRTLAASRASRRSRRWNAPSSRSGSPIANSRPRNSRRMRRSTNSPRPGRAARRVARTARTRRPNAGPSPRRYPAWC